MNPLRTLFVLLLAAGVTSAAALRLKVSDSKRFLVYEDGKPFFSGKNFPAPGAK